MYTEGVAELELESGSIRSLIRELRRRYPDIPEDIEDELAVSIDGLLHQDEVISVINSEIDSATTTIGQFSTPAIEGQELAEE